MKMKISKTIDVRLIDSITELYLGQWVYLGNGSACRVIFQSEQAIVLRVEESDVDIPLFKDMEAAVIPLIGVFVEDFTSLANSAYNAAPAEVSVSTLSDFEKGDELYLGPQGYGKVTGIEKNEDEVVSVSLHVFTNDGQEGYGRIDKNTSPEIISQIKRLKYH